MLRKLSKVLALGLAGAIALTGCGGGKTAEVNGQKDQASNEKNQGNEGEPTIIRIGSHAAHAMDPNHKDPATGEYSMEEDREAALQAMQIVKDKLNVEIEWVQFAGDTTEVLLQSVMAGDPVADVVNLYANSQGIILGQNVLQPLDDYIEYFPKDREVPSSVYGKQYFIDVSGGGTHPLSPLFYNINYIEQVDALKENGKTIYPTDLYKEGKWTWSVFQDYLAKINAHYANSQGPERPEKRIDAYRTDYTETLIQAMHAAGGSIYGEEGLGIETEGTKEAVAYVDSLLTKGLLQTELVEGTSNRPYNAQGEPFEMGESVFTNIEDWRSDGAASKAAERGQSLGFIPFPRPDHMAVDDPNYRQVRTGGESWGVLRGVDEEKIPLIIQTYDMFMTERTRLVREIIGDDDEAPRIALAIDLFHEEIGADMQEIYYESVKKTVVNELSNMTGIYWDFMKLAGDAIHGIDGSPAYDVALEARKSTITDKIASVEATLNSTEVRDNIPPVFTQVEEGKTYTFPKGTDPASIDWASEFTVEDNIDGPLDAKNIVFDSTATDFDTVGYYAKGVVATIADSNDNEGKQNINITIYDDKNTTPPTVTMKEEMGRITVDQDSTNINWANDFVETAEDKDGLDLKSKVVADLSELDTTTTGTYNVDITVTDHAGNETTTTIEVEVTVE